MMDLPLGSWRVSAPLHAVAVSALLLSGGCDPTVDVLEPSDRYEYSLFGVLNVAADTQIIRVEPLGDSTQIGAPPSLDATVVLENLDTGTEVALHDSFDAVGGGLASVHNAWTTHPIRAGTSYRITVQENETIVASATTSTPARAPVISHIGTLQLPCLFDQYNNPLPPPNNTFTIEVNEVPHVAAVRVRYPIDSTFFDYDHLDETTPPFELPVFYAADLTTISRTAGRCVSDARFFRDHVLVAVAGGGPDWPHWRGLPINEIARPDSFSNVEGGHGFIGGIYSDTIEVPIQERSN